MFYFIKGSAYIAMKKRINKVKTMKLPVIRLTYQRNSIQISFLQLLLENERLESYIIYK